MEEPESSDDIDICTINRLVTVRHQSYSKRAAKEASEHPHVLHYAHCLSYEDGGISPADDPMVEQYVATLDW